MCNDIAPLNGKSSPSKRRVAGWRPRDMVRGDGECGEKMREECLFEFVLLVTANSSAAGTCRKRERGEHLTHQRDAPCSQQQW